MSYACYAQSVCLRHTVRRLELVTLLSSILSVQGRLHVVDRRTRRYRHWRWYVFLLHCMSQSHNLNIAFSCIRLHYRSPPRHSLEEPPPRVPSCKCPTLYLGRSSRLQQAECRYATLATLSTPGPRILRRSTIYRRLPKSHPRYQCQPASTTATSSLNVSHGHGYRRDHERVHLSHELCRPATARRWYPIRSCAFARYSLPIYFVDLWHTVGVSATGRCRESSQCSI